MGVVKRHMDKTPAEPEVVLKVRREISERIAVLAGISLEAATALFDRSFLAKTAAVTPWPLLHEPAEYWAQLVLERERAAAAAETIAQAKADPGT